MQILFVMGLLLCHLFLTLAIFLIGTLNLHHFIKSREEVDFIVLYSSIVTIVGNRGQTSYSAANEFLNGFAEYQSKVHGMPYFAVCWGAMSGAGMLDRMKNVARLLERDGIFMLDIEQGMKAERIN